MCKYKIFLLIVIAVFSFRCGDEKKHGIKVSYLGVWGNDSCEYVRTPDYSLLFLKNKELYLCNLFQFTNIKGDFHILTNASFCIDKQKRKTHALAFSLKDANNIMYRKGNSEKLNLVLGSAKYINKEKEEITVSNKKFESFNKKSQKLTLYIDNKAIELYRVEKIKMRNSPSADKAKETNLSVCMREWQLGTKMKTNSENVILNICTNNFNFNISYGKYKNKELIYARAARFVANNKGCLLKQTFRIIDAPHEYSAWIAEKHAENLKTEPKLSILNFKEGAEMERNSGEYWKIIKFNEKTITLKNNKGKKFIIKYPEKKENEEYFSYLSKKNR